MEEVDSIILHALRQLNTDIPTSIQSLGELSIEDIFLAVSSCIQAINPAYTVSVLLPKGVSQKIELAGKLANVCKQLGYQNELGYHTLLYNHEKDLRKLFMFLVENLPTEQNKAPDEEQCLDHGSALKQKICNRINEEINSLWIQPTSVKTKKTFSLIDCKDLLEDQYTQIKVNSSKPSEGEKNYSSNEIHYGDPNTVAHNVNEILDGNDSKKEVINNLKTELIILKEKLSEVEIEKNRITKETLQMQFGKTKVEREISEMESLQEMMNHLGVSKENGIEYLIKELKNEIEKLSVESDNWTQKIITMKSSTDKAIADLENIETEPARRKIKVINMKKSVKELRDNIRKKEIKKIELKRELDKLNAIGAKNRSFYTKKIMDILGNEEKQKGEIEKIISDTHEIDKEIQSTTRQLDRTFSMAEQLFHKNSKSDNQIGKALSLITILRNDCSRILKYIMQTGNIMSDMIEVEDKINIEKSKRLEEITKRIQEDLKQMQHEISLLRT